MNEPEAAINPDRVDVGGYERASDWSALHVVVAGIGVAGFACADALLELGAEVLVVDGGSSPTHEERARILEVLGARIRLGDGDTLPPDTGPQGPIDLLVVSPGLRPAAPLIRAARAAGIPVWGELELAWRLRRPVAPGGEPAPWLVVTGTNGKTTTTLMLASILTAAGLRTRAAGNIGHSMVDVVMRDELDVVAVEVGAPQLPFVDSMSPQAAACLNVALDHVDHFGSTQAYREAKGRIYARTQIACIYNVADPVTEELVAEAEVIEGCRAIGFTLGAPGRSMVGVVDDLLVDRAFITNRATHAQELASVHDVKPFAPHNVENALAAIALARAHGVSPEAVRAGLRAFVPAGHRIAHVADVDDVRYVDDSKATNGHAAQMSLLAYEPVVWIAGGLAKGQSFDELVQATARRLRAVVLLGADRGRIREALEREAPDIPVVEIADPDATTAMPSVVAAAAALAQPGDTVLLAPGCASWDMFTDYAARGDAFAAAVRAL